MKEDKLQKYIDFFALCLIWIATGLIGISIPILLFLFIMGY